MTNSEEFTVNLAHQTRFADLDAAAKDVIRHSDGQVSVVQIRYTAKDDTGGQTLQALRVSVWANGSLHHLRDNDLPGYLHRPAFITSWRALERLASLCGPALYSIYGKLNTIYWNPKVGEEPYSALDIRDYCWDGLELLDQTEYR